MTTETFNPPSQEGLEAKAKKYLRTCKPQEYKKLKASGELQEYCQLAARAAKRYAESLIKGGVWEREAWNRAIRMEILGSESD